MPTIQDQVSIAAGAVVNLVAGNQYEYLPNDAAVQIGLLARATGIRATIISGSDLLCQEGAVQVNATADSFPKYPDDFTYRDVASAGDRLNVQVRNTTAGAVVVAFSVKLDWM